MEDFKKASGVNYIYIEEDTKVEEITITDIVITIHPVRSDVIFTINLDTN
jgi:hypothetical protein